MDIRSKKVDLLNKDYQFGADNEIQSKYTVNAKSGLGVRFLTNSKYIKVSLLFDRLALVNPQIGSTLTNGLYFCIYDSFGALIAHNVCVNKDVENEHILFNSTDAKDVQCEIFLPILNKVAKLELIMVEDSYIEAFDKRDQIVVCGGRLTYGVGCTFANAMYPNILARRLCCDLINLSVYDVNWLHHDIGENVCEYSPRAIITECSCKGMSVDYMKNNLSAYLRNIAKKNPLSWLIIIGEDEWYMNNEKRMRKKIEMDTVLQLRHENIPNILYVNLQDIFKDKSIDMLTYSINFYNDYANNEIAEYLVSILKACIEGTK